MRLPSYSSFLKGSFVYFWVLLGMSPATSAQQAVNRQVQSVVATSSGSGIAALIVDAGRGHEGTIAFLSPATGRVLWQVTPASRAVSVAVSPDGRTVAVGLFGVSGREDGVLLLDSQTGKQVGGIGAASDSYFVPGLVYPRYGSGVSQLRYSKDGKTLYGLSNDTLFAWDVPEKKYLWTVDVPAEIEAPKDMPDPLPYGHSTDFVVSPDDRQIAAVRDVVRVTGAGRTRPQHFIRRTLAGDTELDSVAFSADGRVLAIGGASGGNGKPVVDVTEFWTGPSLRSTKLTGCGGTIAWTTNSAVFACENGAGTHLRNLNDLNKDIGTAGPFSQLPLIPVGDSLWVAAYKQDDWKDPGKPFPLTLVELGTGKRVTVNLPGRSEAPGK